MIPQQLPSCFLLLLDLHTPQPWDATSPLLMWAALPLNTSPLAHLSHAPPCLADPLPGSHRPAWSNRERPVSPHAGLGYVQPPRGLGSQPDAFWPPLMSVFLDGAHPLQHKPQELITLCQGYHVCKIVIIHHELCLAHPLHIRTPLSVMLEAAQHWGKSWAQLKKTQQTSSEGRSFQLRKTSVLNSAHPSTLKMSPGSTNTTAAGQARLLVAGKAKIFLFSERCRWSRCRVGVDFISCVEHEGSQKGWGEAGAAMCNGAVGSQEVALEPDHTVAPDPLPHFQERGTLQLS